MCSARSLEASVVRLGLHSSPCDDDRYEGRCGGVVPGGAVVSCCDAPPVLGPSEHPFDNVSAPVSVAVEWAGRRRGGGLEHRPKHGFSMVFRHATCQSLAPMRDHVEEMTAWHPDCASAARRLFCAMAAVRQRGHPARPRSLQGTQSCRAFLQQSQIVPHRRHQIRQAR